MRHGVGSWFGSFTSPEIFIPRNTHRGYITCAILHSIARENERTCRWWPNRGPKMLLAGKAVGAGITFILLTIGTSGTRPTTVPSALGFSNPARGWANPVEVRKMQQTLRDQGHYRGEVDGVFGLRTRASIRGFQKAAHLPVTGQLDTSTAVKLGVRLEVREETGYETTEGKPSPGIKWCQGSGRTSKTLRKPVKRSDLPLFSCALPR
jgi:hypothetical protein